jgi:dienelactone hydrolase
MTRVVLAVLALAIVHQESSPTIALPKPTGPFPVATTTWRVTDPARKETFTAAGESRQVEVMAWYPAAAPRRTGALAPYLREGLPEVRTFATALRGSRSAFDALEKVATHAELDGAPRVGARKLPVLVFSAGYTGVPSSHTALLEDLASHGYAVLNIVHPYEETAATLADGRVVTTLTGAGTMLPGLSEVFSEWRTEDDTMAAVTKSEEAAEQDRVMRGYLAGLKNTQAALTRWVDDAKLVLDRLSAAPPRSAASRLVAVLDLARLGAFGHSMGGVMAGQFCLDDRRCKAGLNLDGIPQSGTMIDGSMQRPFMMVYSARPGRVGANDVIYKKAARPYYRADVKDTRHLDFTDMVFWGGLLRERPILGSIAATRVTDITRILVRRYFDQELLGQRAALTGAVAPLSEVAFRTITPAR